MQITNSSKILAAIFSMALLTGCVSQPKTIYSWGSYEQQVYSHFNGESQVKQIEQLENDLQQANAQNKLPPPGLYAHLGLLYAETGNPAKAEENLQQEKRLFPESASYIDLLLKQRK